MKEMALKNGVILVDDDIYENFLPHKNKMRLCGYGYPVIYLGKQNGKMVKKKLHRLIMGEPEGMQVDHIDRNRRNNQRSNLRVVTNQQNDMNRGPRESCASRYKGVGLVKTKYKDKVYLSWVARLRKNGKLIFIKYCKTEIEAAKAYDKAAIEHFGKYAYLNFSKEVRAALGEGDKE